MNAPAKIELPPDAQLCAALAKALPALGAVHKNKKNPAFKSNYADIAAVIGALAPLAEFGLWFRQVPVDRPDGVAVETFYIHESGAEMSAGVTVVPVAKRDAHGIGSASTYCRRYALMTAFGLAADDDDGNAAAKDAPKADARINDAQWAQLVQMIEATKADTQSFCTAYRIDSLRDLPAAAFDRAIAQLTRKLGQMTQEMADA